MVRGKEVSVVALSHSLDISLSLCQVDCQVIQSGGPELTWATIFEMGTFLPSIFLTFVKVTS